MTLLLLAATFVLAAAMTWRRSSHPLGPRIFPRGWSISFEPPRRFPTARAGSTGLGAAYLFTGATRSGAPALLAVYRLVEPIPANARAVCERVLRFHSWVPPAGRRPDRLIGWDRKIGPLDAVEIRDLQRGVVVRGVLLGPDEAYAFLLGVEGRPIDRQTYRLFDGTCRSVQFIGDDRFSSP